MTRSRRYLLGLDPIFEGGWLHKGRRARSWNVEEDLVAVSILADVTIDLSNVKSLPSDVHISAYAIVRDVDLVVPAGTHVESAGRPNNDHVSHDATSVATSRATHSVTIDGHTFLGDVNIRN